MIYIWIGLGVLGILLLTPLVIGCLLPERFEGRVTARLSKPVDEVWEALQDFESHPMTGKMMKSVEILPEEDGLPAWREDMGHGELITVKTVERNEPHRLCREMSSASLPMTSRWEYELAPDQSACRVTLYGETFIRNGSWMSPVFRFMMLIGGGVKKGLQIQLDMISQSRGAEIQYD